MSAAPDFAHARLGDSYRRDHGKMMWIAILAHRIGLDFVRSPSQHSPSSSWSPSCAASACLTSAGLGQRIIMRLRPGILCTRPLEPRLLNRGCSRQMVCRGKWGHRVSPIPDRIRSGLPGTEVGVGLVMSQISPLGPLNSHHRRTLELVLQERPRFLPDPPEPLWVLGLVPRTAMHLSCPLVQHDAAIFSCPFQ